MSEMWLSKFILCPKYGKKVANFNFALTLMEKKKAVCGHKNPFISFNILQPREFFYINCNAIEF